MKTKIIATGLSGLVGSKVVEFLGEEFDFEDISRKTGTDITDSQSVLKRMQESSAEFVLHLAAYTNVDEAEKDKDKKSESIAWKINVEGTRNVVDAVEKTKKHLIHVSTDMVFSGTKALPGRYREEDLTNPVGWYATTKAQAEKIVQQSTTPWTIIRIAYPYFFKKEKLSYVTLFHSFLSQKKEIRIVTDHFFTPVFLDDIPNVFKKIFQEKHAGIYHAGGKDSINPYDIALKIADLFEYDKKYIIQTTREEFFAGKAPRAYNLSLNSDKIGALGVSLRGIDEGLLEIKKQL